MRENWNRATAEIELAKNELEVLLRPAFPNAQLVDAALTRGGLANTNIRVRIAGHERPYLLRLYVRDPQQAAKEFAINKLVHKTVPSPEFIYFGDTNEFTNHPYAIMEWIDGERFESVLPNLSPAKMRHSGESIGRALAAIHAYKFADFGFFDERLTVAHPIEIGGAGLIAFVEDCLNQPHARERAGEELAQQLIDFVKRESPLLDQWQGEPSLTHADFGGSNILVRNKHDGWDVSAILDWEFAFSGSPFFDFGNLLRAPVGNSETFTKGLVDAYVSSGGVLPKDWRKMSLLTDLTAWTEFLTRPNINQALVADARRVIAQTMDQWQNR